MYIKLKFYIPFFKHASFAFYFNNGFYDHLCKDFDVRLRRKTSY